MIKPYPENLDVLMSCRDCNGNASKDEEYVACAIEIAKQGSLELSSLRKKISEVLTYQTKLYERLKEDVVTAEPFELKIDIDRFHAVFLKLARGHAAHELSYFDYNENCKISWSSLVRLTNNEIELFMKPPELDLFPEIGSRGMQRAFEHGQYIWVEVQEDQYYYLACDTSSGVIVRILISNYLAIEALFPSD